MLAIIIRHAIVPLTISFSHHCNLVGSKKRFQKTYRCITETMKSILSLLSCTIGGALLMGGSLANGFVSPGAFTSNSMMGRVGVSSSPSSSGSLMTMNAAERTYIMVCDERTAIETAAIDRDDHPVTSWRRRSIFVARLLISCRGRVPSFSLLARPLMLFSFFACSFPSTPQHQIKPDGVQVGAYSTS